MADYPLDKQQARDIAGVVGKSIDAESYDYFLEPYVQPAHRRTAQRAISTVVTACFSRALSKLQNSALGRY